MKKSLSNLSVLIEKFCKKVNVKDLPHDSELTKEIRRERFENLKSKSKLNKRELNHVFFNILKLGNDEA
jgi:hypothetical protein